MIDSIGSAAACWVLVGRHGAPPPLGPCFTWKQAGVEGPRCEGDAALLGLTGCFLRCGLLTHEIIMCCRQYLQRLGTSRQSVHVSMSSPRPQVHHSGSCFVSIGPNEWTRASTPDYLHHTSYFYVKQFTVWHVNCWTYWTHACFQVTLLQSTYN